MKISVQRTQNRFLYRMVPIMLLMLGAFFVSAPANRLVAQSGTATVSVAHFAPFADSVDGTAVTVRVDGVDAIPDFKFGTVVNDISLAEGDHLIEILVGDAVALSGNVSLMADTGYTLAAVGGANGYDLMLKAFVKETTPDPDNAKLFVGHLAPFNADIDATQVDICTDDNAVVLPGVPYLGFTDPYLVLPPGDYNLKIAVAGTDCGTVALDLDSIRLAAGDIVDVFAIGLLTDAFPLQLQTTTGFTPTPAPGTATVSVAHFAPFADSVDGTAVTVRVDGVDAIPDFKFGTVVNDISLAEGDHLIEILVGDAVALSGNVSLMADTGYTLAAVGGANGYDLMLKAFVKETTPDPDNAKLFVGHLAPFNADIDATQVDICTDDNAVVLPGVPYLGFTDPYLVLPPGDYNLKIAVAGTDCGTVALDLDSIRLAAGDIVDVFAIGLLTDAFPLQLQTTTGFTPTPAPGTATVSVAHFAPFADSVDGTAVTVRVDGVDAIPDFKFGTVVNDISLAEGDHLIEILVGDAVALSGNVSLMADTGYTLAAVGGANGYDLMLKAFVKETTPDPDNAKLFVGHLAPFNADIDATQVDICTDDNAVVLPGVPYLGFTDPYLVLPPGDYNLKITVAGTDCGTVALDLDSIRLAAGDIVDVFAIGLLTDAFPLQLQTTTGFTPTPAPGTATVVYVSSSSGGKVADIRFADEDILAYDIASDAWAKYFDGSDVGITRNDLDAFTVLDDGSILMSFSRGLRLSGLDRRVESSDIVKFVPQTLGEETSGTFELYFDGADVGLTGWRDNMEDIDAIALDPQGRLVISTKGTFHVPGIRGRDEDLVLFNAESLGEDTRGVWERYFDGSDVGLRSSSEDVNGAWIDQTGDIYLTTKGDFSVKGVEGDGSDIFICTPLSLGADTACEYSFFWDSAGAGFGGKNVDGFAIGTIFPPANSAVSRDAVESATAAEERVDEDVADDNDSYDDESDSDSLHAADDVATGSNDQVAGLQNEIFLPLIDR